MKWRLVKRQQGIHIYLLGTPTRSSFNRYIICCAIFVPRINLDSIQSEANALVSRLTLTKKKVSSSVDEVKEQFTKVIEVG